MVGLERLSVDQIFDSAWSSDHNLYSSIFQCIPVLLGVSASNAATCGNVDELAEAEDDLVDLLRELSGWGKNDGLALWGFIVDELKYSNGEGCGFAGS